MTYAQLALPFSPESTCSAEDSHARMSAAPARARGSRGLDPASGTSTSDSSANSNPAPSSSRTSRAAPSTGCARCGAACAMLGTVRPPMPCEPATLALRTDEPESSLWPTPTVSGNHNRKGASKESGDGLSTAVAKWPTPCASDWKSGASNLHGVNSRPLREVVRLYPTPAASNYGSNRGGAAGRTGPDRPSLRSLYAPLNPAWVEAVMGFPPGWTDVGPQVPAKRSKTGNLRARRAT